MEKKCFKCNESKPLTDFYKHSQMADGHLNKCKECNKKDVQKNYKNNREYYLEYEKRRPNQEERQRSRKMYSRKMRKEYPEMVKTYHDKYKEKYPERIKATDAVSNALRVGKLSKGKCVVCGGTKVHGHHEDYNKPLDVTWLCQKHHVKVHSGELILKEIMESKG